MFPCESVGVGVYKIKIKGKITLTVCGFRFWRDAGAVLFYDVSGEKLNGL